jgi:hypothetical protein
MGFAFSTIDRQYGNNGPKLPDSRPLVPEQRNPHTGVSALVNPGGWIFQFSLSKKR